MSARRSSLHQTLKRRNAAFIGLVSSLGAGNTHDEGSRPAASPSQGMDRPGEVRCHQGVPAGKENLPARRALSAPVKPVYAARGGVLLLRAPVTCASSCCWLMLHVLPP